jgi:hypothetical protein
MANLLKVIKFNPYHDELGRFATASGFKTVTTSNVEVAARALAAGKPVRLRHTREVSTLLDQLAKISREAIAKGEKAPNYNLCNVSVKGTNLFCSESKGIPRIQMPQLKGVPLPGSMAAKRITPDARGEYDVSGKFRAYLERKGVEITNSTEDAAYLKASQNELSGSKTAGIAGAIRAGKLADERIFVSRDNYIVDGHHRWSASVGVDSEDGVLGDVKMKVARINMDIITLLAEANKFAKRWGLPQASVTAKNKDPMAKKAEGCGCGGCQ